jgi:hypothetical protein
MVHGKATDLHHRLNVFAIQTAHAIESASGTK